MLKLVLENTFVYLRILLLSCIILLPIQAIAEQKSFILQSTTSTANSGLYDYLLPLFKNETGIDVHVVAVGTGQALKNAMNGDGDVLLVHAKTAEEKFVADGFGVDRRDVMYNDFVIVGPASDPADISHMELTANALKSLADKQNLFVSRGDNSGTHKKELNLWSKAGITVSDARSSWYRESGTGMGATLNIAIGMGAYTLTDRATWISFKNKGNYEVHVEGGNDLFNQYGIMLVNPERHANVKSVEGQAFIEWITHQKGQSAIADYKLKGQQLFFPNAKREDQLAQR